MADVIFLILLMLHLVFIVAWLGGGVLFVSIITPALAQSPRILERKFIVAVLPRYTRFIRIGIHRGDCCRGVVASLH